MKYQSIQTVFLFHTAMKKIIQNILNDLNTQKILINNNQTEEAERLERTELDVEMIKELGYCPGIENYSRYFDNRKRRKTILFI